MVFIDKCFECGKTASLVDLQCLKLGLITHGEVEHLEVGDPQVKTRGIYREFRIEAEDDER